MDVQTKHILHDDYGFADDGYDYSKHLKTIGDGVFIHRQAGDASMRQDQRQSDVVSLANSRASTTLSRRSRVSLAGEIRLMETMPESFESKQELEVSVGGTLDGYDVEEDPGGEELRGEDPEMFRLLYAGVPGVDVGEEEDDPMEELEEIDDEFVLQADRGVEWLLDTTRRTGKHGTGDSFTNVKNGAVSSIAEEMDGEGDFEGANNADFGRSSKLHEAQVYEAQIGRNASSSEARMLDRQFERLAVEYEEDEIGELDEMDPQLRSGADLEQFDSVLDDFLEQASGANRAVRMPNRHVDGKGVLDEWRCGWGGRIGDAAGKLIAADAGESDPANKLKVEEQRDSAEGSGSSSESDIEDHPFLAAPTKREEWDAETILTTYSTLDNHPTDIRVRRKARKHQVVLDRSSGLPMGVVLPHSKESRVQVELPVHGGVESDGSVCDGDQYADEGEVINRGEARRRGETAEERRARKGAAKEAKAARRAEKKGTKVAFKEERARQQETLERTRSVRGTNLSR